MTKISDLYGMLPDMFSVSNVKRSLKEKVTARSVNRIISSYVEKGALVRLRSGTYAKKSADGFAVANFVYRGYIGLSSALYLHGLKTEIEGTITVCVNTRAKPVIFVNVLIKPVYIPKMLYGTVLLGDAIVSTYPKTLFDMLLMPRYSSFFDFYRALNYRRLNDSEWEELLMYERKANIATVRRTGYALEKFAPKWFLDKLAVLDKRKGKSFFTKKIASNFNKRWLIYDAYNIKRWENAV